MKKHHPRPPQKRTKKAKATQPQPQQPLENNLNYGNLLAVALMLCLQKQANDSLPKPPPNLEANTIMVIPIPKIEH